MEVRPPRQLVKFNEDNTQSDVPVVTTVPDLADHPLGKGNTLNTHHISIAKQGLSFQNASEKIKHIFF